MNAEEITDAAASGQIAVPDAIAQLEALGYERALARETIFLAVGGDDVVALGDDGIQRYDRSGKAVSEVDQLMGDAADE